MSFHHLLLCAALAAPFCQADPLSVPFGAGGGFNVQVRSLKERAFQYTVRQRYDFSCGSAALASLLTYHYNMPTREEDVFQSMYQFGDKDKIARIGFSMADMRAYLDRLGLESNGFKVSLEKLEEARAPVIVIINSNGYRHFVVLKGIHPDKVLIGDPALGTRTMPRDEFLAAWNRVIFVILDKKSLAQAHFNLEQEWSLRASAPLELARYDPVLGNLSFMRRAGSDF